MREKRIEGVKLIEVEIKVMIEIKVEIEVKVENEERMVLNLISLLPPLPLNGHVALPTQIVIVIEITRLEIEYPGWPSLLPLRFHLPLKGTTKISHVGRWQKGRKGQETDLGVTPITTKVGINNMLCP